MNTGATERVTAPVLVIGVGSQLRRDDAAGRRVAEQVAMAELPGVEVRSLQQLTPELAVDLAGRALAIFVDASVEVTELTVAELDGPAGSGSMSHHLDPPTLLALAERLEAGPDRAVVVHVPVQDLGLGTRLSPTTRRMVEQAVVAVTDLVAVALSPSAPRHRVPSWGRMPGEPGESGEQGGHGGSSGLGPAGPQGHRP